MSLLSTNSLPIIVKAYIYNLLFVLHSFLFTQFHRCYGREIVGIFLVTHCGRLDFCLSSCVRVEVMILRFTTIMYGMWKPLLAMLRRCDINI